MYKRSSISQLSAHALALLLPTMRMATPMQSAMLQPGAFASARNQRGSCSPIHPKRGTPPAKRRSHAKHRGARAARRRARLSGRG